MTFAFASKARTLAALRPKLSKAAILPIVAFSVEEWRNQPQRCVAHVHETLATDRYIVRSSAIGEDGSQASLAGAFLSVTEVGGANLAAAIEQVIASYRCPTAADEVLIQPMLTNVVAAGVAFSHDPNTCAPYRVINWSDGPDTAAVTSGRGGRCWQQAATADIASPPEIEAVLSLLDELLALIPEQPLDLEFAFTQTAGESRRRLWLLQVRPLLLRRPAQPESAQSDDLEIVARKVSQGLRPHPFLMGRRTVYGVMPDWNPAEMIGTRPKPLALSLYRDLITDATWAYQRHNYGYRNLRSFPLMPHFLGLPYIDVRVSFNSFVPADLEEGIARRLVDYYIDELVAQPGLHDKVEFEIVFSCYTLDLPQRLARLSSAGFSAADRDALAVSLRRLTNRVIDPKDGLWRTDAAKLNVLEARREKLMRESDDPVERIYWLLEDAKRYGTLPFAGLARAAFIAVQFLRSLIASGVFTPQNYNDFLAAICTVGRQLARDRANLDKTTFLARYGHLRPGTYDILSPRYDEAPDLYFDWQQKLPVPDSPKPFSVRLDQLRRLSDLLGEHGLQPDPVGLFEFLQAAIEQRELAKFRFTRNVSDALALMAELGGRMGFSREDIAYCHVDAFRELYISAGNGKEILARSIDEGRARHQKTLSLALPPLITSPDDVWGFEWPDTLPNFVTQECVTAKVVSCDARNLLGGAIVCIPGADPGFDWLFSHPIAGLITAWGGANSHMAIRACELGLPAVIGAGEKLYQKWSAANRLLLDCANRRVEVLA